MSKQDPSDKMQSLWLKVFNNSKVNGAEYREDRLPSQSWLWPTDTFLQRRLRQVRANGADEPVIVAQNPTLRQTASRNEGATPQIASQSAAAKRAVDNATRPERNGNPPKGCGTVIEWEDIDERLNWFARPNHN